MNIPLVPDVETLLWIASAVLLIAGITLVVVGMVKRARSQREFEASTSEADAGSEEAR